MTIYRGGKSNEELTSPFIVGPWKFIPREERLPSGVRLVSLSSHTCGWMTLKYTDKSNEELASMFIAGTCQLIPRSFPAYSDHMHNVQPSKSPESKEYLILCGSNAEFYIRPLITCIGDIDNLIARTDELVFDGNFPVCPSDRSGLSDTVTCYKIEPYDRYPGFVRLRIWGKMTFNWEYNKYELIHAADFKSRNVVLDLREFASRYSNNNDINGTLQKDICGPAIKQRSKEIMRWFNEIDFVKSLWCPQWPKEAQVWLSRPRSNGWPTIDTIMEIVQNGCHVVYVQHRACRNEEHQWRLSFSLAEVMLLMSWTPKQQIVYHLLRFFAKRVLIEKNCPKDDEVLCPYHLKTLMLWTCEEMSPEWWNFSSVIAICCELLKMLTLWLEKRHFPNYFIPEANLFQDQSNSRILEQTLRCLKKFSNSGILCHWFVDNYIMDYIRRHFKPMEDRIHFLNYMLPLFEIWNSCQFKSIEFYFCNSFTYSEKCRSIMKEGLDHGVFHCFQTAYTHSGIQLNTTERMEDHPTIQKISCLRFHSNLLYILRIAHVLGCGEISWDSNLFVETVNTISSQPQIIRSKYHNFPKACPSFGSLFQFLCAQDFMKNLTGSNSRSEFHILSLVTKGFLTKTLTNDGTIFNGIIPSAFAYLAALQFATSEYQEATRLCSAVLVDQVSTEDKKTLNAGCLLFIDDVARIVGLCVLKKKIRDNSLHYINKRLYLDLRLSPEVVAQHVSVLSAERISKQSDFYHDLPGLSFPMDVNLKALIKSKCICSMKSGSHYNASRQIVYRRPYLLIETEASYVNPLVDKERVIDVLMEYALENMTSFFNVISTDFGVSCNTGDCYRALYLYKCRKYDQVLHLCERILHTPSVESDLQNYLKEFAFTNILLLSPLDSFFDREVQSLLGLHTLLHYISPLNDDLEKVELRHGSSFEHWFATSVYKYDMELSYSLHQGYPIKCQYFLGRHFLARYLKLRCFIDSNLPFEEVLTEFSSQKTDLPFERIIRKFLLRKLHFTKQNSTVSSYH